MNPSSLLVPIGTTAVFECKVRHCLQRTCSVHWIINGSSTAHDHQQTQHEEHGFAFSHQRNTTTSVYTGRLAILASEGVNNTDLCCLIQDGINHSRKSGQATLLVISGMIFMQIDIIADTYTLSKCMHEFRCNICSFMHRTSFILASTSCMTLVLHKK